LFFKELPLIGYTWCRGACVERSAGWKIATAIRQFTSQRTAFQTTRGRLMTTTAASTYDDISTKYSKVTWDTVCGLTIA